MLNPEKKKTNTLKKPRSSKTGEDIDMLHERETDPQDDYWGESSYKNNIDGA